MALEHQDNTTGRYGDFGGAYIPEGLATAIAQLNEAWKRAKEDTAFQHQLQQQLKHYAGRPTALTEVPRFADAIGGPTVFLKREDLLHTGAHKLNNALGQCLLAKTMGKTRVIAETGAGQHGVAVATACAHIGLECVVFMGSVDMERQQPNVKRMLLLGAEVVPASDGSATLKEAVNAAMRDWSASYEDTHYCLGSALGPHPFPEIVRELQSVIGNETKTEIVERCGRLPDMIIACVGGGSNAIGIFAPFIENDDVALVGVEAGGRGMAPGEHAARFSGGRPGVLHGCYSYLLQDDAGQVLPTHSVSAGLDYPSIGPQHAHLHDSGRAQYVSVTDDEAVAALKLLCCTEGIIPALESSHALAHLAAIAPQLDKDAVVIVNLSGRGDKDLEHLFTLENMKGVIK